MQKFLRDVANGKLGRISFETPEIVYQQTNDEEKLHLEEEKEDESTTIRDITTE
jgi:ribosome biogenesis GTPase A